MHKLMKLFIVTLITLETFYEYFKKRMQITSNGSKRNEKKERKACFVDGANTVEVQLSIYSKKANKDENILY